MLDLIFPIALLGLAAVPVPPPQEEPAIATVTVNKKKPPVSQKVDKTVHDVSDLARAASGTAQDVLQSTPNVSVSADGQIAVNGNKNVTVLVNGKPTAMMAGEERAVALQTMSGADIASVEVITNPSAAYAANGGAILNIVLKRNRKPGKHAQVRASVADQSLWNAGISGDVNTNALSVNGSLAFRHDGTLKMRRSAVEWRNPVSGDSGQTTQTSEVFVRRTVRSAGLGVEYAITDRDSLGMSARYNARQSRPTLDTLNVERHGADETIFHRISVGPNEQTDSSVSLNYSHQGQGRALKAMAQRSNTVGLIDKSFSDVFVQPSRATLFSRGATRSARHLTQATLDWSGLVQHGQWGAGLDLQEEVNDLDNYQAALDPLAGTETPDARTSNGYAVKTRLSAAYVTRQLKSEQWEVLLGARMENAALRVNPVQGLAETRHWRAFNPSFHGRYQLSDATDLTLSYRRSLQRPDPRDLNPFTTYIDAQNLSRGNPQLKPQRMTAWEMGANGESGPVSGSLGAFYRTSRDTVTDVRSFDADNVIVTSRQNGGRARSLGVTAAADWKSGTGMRLGLDGGAYRVMLQTPDLQRVVRQSGWSNYLNVRAGHVFGQDDLSLDAHFQSKGITALGTYGATSSVNLTWKRQLNKTLSLTVNANDVFDGSQRSYTTDAGTFRLAGFDHFVARRLYVGLVKKFQ